jgi:hypothetical protein
MSTSGTNNSLAGMRKKLAALNSGNNKQAPHKYSPEERLVKLKAILKELKKGNHVQNRRLKTWLTDDEYSGFEGQWNGQKELRAERSDKPHEILEYEELLQKGIFSANRANAYDTKGRKKGAEALSYEAQSLYETALEYLHEILTADPSLERWLDRHVDFTAGREPSLDGVGMPRATTSRSLDNQGGGLLVGEMSKVEVKIDVVERAIASLRGD